MGVQPRMLASSEIQEALEAGSLRAQKILNEASDDVMLHEKFGRVVWCADHLLENFDLKKYHERGNNDLPVDRLRKMLLDSFKSVQTMRELEDVIAALTEFELPSGDTIKRTASLLSAATVFQTLGSDDIPILRVMKTVQDYQSTSHIHREAA